MQKEHFACEQFLKILRSNTLDAREPNKTLNLVEMGISQLFGFLQAKMAS